MLFYKKTDISEVEASFCILYKKYRFFMMKVAMNILQDRYFAEDAVQDAFIRVAGYMDKLNDMDARETKRFLIVLTKNASIDIYRKRSKQMKKEIFLDELGASEPSVNMETDMENCVLDVLKSLPVKYRDVFLLKYSNKLENFEVAQLPGITEGNVRQRIARGKVMVQNALNEMEDNRDGAYNCNR